MKAFLFVIIFLPCATTGFGQNRVLADTSDCLRLLERLSENWKSDSTGNDGFRYENRKYLFSCKRQNLTKQLLLKYLGKPNQIRDVVKGKEFLYYHYDFRTLPKGKDGPLACLYIIFMIPDGQEYISNISEGDTDL